MTNQYLRLFSKEIIHRKDHCLRSVRFHYIPKNDKGKSSKKCGRLRVIDSIVLMNMSLDTFVEALHKDENSLQENFVHTETELGDE